MKNERNKEEIISREIRKTEGEALMIKEELSRYPSIDKPWLNAHVP